MENTITIERPYEAEDNAINLAERELLQRYCNRHDEEINTFVIYAYFVEAHTVSGRKFIAKNANEQYSPCKKFTEYLYLNEEINGKQKRIKKSEY